MRCQNVLIRFGSCAAGILVLVLLAKSIAFPATVEPSRRLTDAEMSRLRGGSCPGCNEVASAYCVKPVTFCGPCKETSNGSEPGACATPGKYWSGRSFIECETSSYNGKKCQADHYELCWWWQSCSGDVQAQKKCGGTTGCETAAGFNCRACNNWGPRKPDLAHYKLSSKCVDCK